MKRFFGCLILFVALFGYERVVIDGSVNSTTQQIVDRIMEGWR